MLTRALSCWGRASSAADMVRSIEKRIMVQHRSNEASQRSDTIPGIGVIGATAIAATVPIRRFFDRVVTSRPGSGSCRAKTPLAETEVRADLETGRSLFATHSGGRSLRGIAIRAP